MRRLLLPLLLVATISVGCGDDPVAPPAVPTPDDNEPVSFSKHIQPIFAYSCSGSECHAGAVPARSLTLQSWATVMEGSEFGAVIVPFAARRSHLLQHISTDTSIAPMALPRMPLGQDALPREQILTIKRWIAEGAKSDAGEVALAGDRPRVLVTNQAEDVVAAIDLGTRRIARYVSVGRRPDESSVPEAPHNIIFAPDGRTFYINLIAAGEIEKYDAVTFEKLGSAPVGLSPAQIAVTADGSTLFVSNFDMTFSQRFITRVAAATMTPLGDIETGGYAPHGVTLSLDGTKLYTTNAGSDDVSEIDVASGDVLRIIPIVPGAPLQPGTKAKHEPYQSVLANGGALLYVTCRASAQVRVLDLETGRTIDSIPVGNRPLILDRTPDSREIWVPNQASESISIIDIETRRVTGTVTGLRTQPHAVAFSPDGRYAFVTCENTTGAAQHHPTQGAKRPGYVYVVDTATRAIVQPIEVGAFAAGIAVTP